MPCCSWEGVWLAASEFRWLQLVDARSAHRRQDGMDGRQGTESSWILMASLVGVAQCKESLETSAQSRILNADEDSIK